MFLSIFTDELHQRDITRALATIRSWGLEYVDFRGMVFGKSIHALDADELAALKKLLADQGLKIGALQSSLCKVHLPDAAGLAAEKEKLEGLARVADALDCRLVRAFNLWQPSPEQRGALAVQPDQLQKVMDLFAPVARRAEEAGLVLAFENCGQTTAEVFALLEALGVPEWGLAWDVANEWDMSDPHHDEADHLIRCAQAAKMVHVKATSILPELKGRQVPWDRVLATCHAAGIDGPVSIETHNPTGSPLDPEEASRQCTVRVRQVWPTAAPGDIRAAAEKRAAPAVRREWEDDPVGFVVVGLGMGKSRSKLIAETPGCRLAGVCDVREERARDVAGMLEVPFSLDYRHWLDDPKVEAVFVLTETGNHANVALDALKAGKHVITTKPMEATLAACYAMVNAARESNVRLAVDFSRRYDADIQTLRGAVESGFFGRVLYTTSLLKIKRTQEYYDENGGWRGTWRLDGGGTLSNQCVHHIDELIYCLGAPEAVRASIYTLDHKIEADDLGITEWRYADGGIVQLSSTTCWPAPEWYHRLEICGTTGAYASGGSGFSEGAPRWFSENRWTTDPPAAVAAPWLNSADNLAAALRTGAPLIGDGESGALSRAVLEAAYTSARHRGGDWVRLDDVIAAARKAAE